MTHLDHSQGHRVSPGGLRHFHLGYTIKIQEKTVQFSFGHRIAIYASNFKKLVSFDIGKVWPIWICQNSWGLMIFRWSKSEICKKMDQNFCNFSKITRRHPKSPILSSFTMNSKRQESEDTKNGQYFEFWSINGDLATIWKMINFFNAFL